MNLIIAGIGGQGVNLLTQIVAQTCRAAGRLCQYTIHKGGAQSLGTVYGELRFFQHPEQILAANIPAGKLDLLIALDTWEALRHLPLAHATTRIWLESEVQPIYIERHQNPANPELLKALEAWSPQWRNYRQQAISQYGDAAMANYLAGLDCLQALEMADSSEFTRLFSKISGKKDIQ